MSRHICNTLLAVAICFLLGRAPALAQDWAPFGMSENGDAITLDVGTIVFGGEAASFTMRVDFNNPSEMEGTMVTHLTSPIEINCVKGTYRRAAVEYRSAKGEVVVAEKASQWSPIPSSSFGTALKKFCK